ncbi:MAG: dihydrolipoamide acetyltransferase family protein [Alphaproteobacteria bacterium]|nr:dihydrolipoamide acetyltransferase family protein [Alphaproteobacteria bacterium]
MAIEKVILPKLGESVMEATIIRWKKQVGDPIKKDETLVEISTDKVDTELPSEFSGTVVEILFQENDIVPIGKIIATIETETHRTSTLNTNHIQTQAQALPLEPPQPAQILKEVLNYAPQENTQNSQSLHIPNIANRFYSPLVLTIAKEERISMQELDTIPRTGNEGRLTKHDLWQYIKHKNEAHPEQNNVQVSNSIENFEKNKEPHLQTDDMKIVKNVTNQLNENSFSKRTITKTDDAIGGAIFEKPKQNSGILSDLEEVMPMDKVRKVIAKNMLESRKISPHVTSFIEIDVTNLVQLRQELKTNFEKREGLKLTFTPILIHCLLKVLPKFPLINSSVEQDKIIIKKYYNIGMATALPNGNLIVPVIKNAGNLNLVEITKAVNNLSEAARQNKLTMPDIEGGTFTVSNIGNFGSMMGTPIILQPQVAIIALGQIKKRPVVIENSWGDSIAIRQIMIASLSYDHRIIDGAMASKFLSAFADSCEHLKINLV